MRKFVHIALAALFLLGIASAQSIPVDFSAGYSYLSYNQPFSSQTPSEQLKLNGWDFSVAIGRFHHFSVEANISGHTLSNCAGATGATCNNISYMFGPRYTYGDRTSRVTVFAHGLFGQDRANLLSDAPPATLSDTAMAFGGGGGIDYWLFRHIGIQAGPFDYIYTNHLNNSGAASEGGLRAAGGIAFRFGGNFPPSEPKAPKEPEAKSESHRSWIRPWHKTKTEPSETEPESQPAPRVAHKTAPPPATVPATVPSHGMAIHPLGLVAGPQEFDGARILSIEPGSVAEMASLHVGDLVKSVDGKAVRTPMELAAELVDKTGKVRIGILRGSVATETVILLGAH
ncbi:MAG TPA: hypothetical protein VJX69_02330 [Terriglobales bacterium]|nr:hypothetical protein [Terriglobales bacterium]